MTYDDLDMDGLQEAWYRDVPIDVQRNVNTVEGEELRVLRNHGPSSPPWTVVAQAPGVQQLYWGGWLCGWAIFMHWDQPLGDGQGIRRNIAAMIRHTEHDDDADSVNAEIDRAKDESWAKFQRQGEAESNDFVNDLSIDGHRLEAAAAKDYERSTEQELDEAHWIAKKGSRNAAPSHVKLVVPVGGQWVEKDVT